MGADVRVGQYRFFVLAEEQYAYIFSRRVFGRGQCARTRRKVLGLHQGLPLAARLGNRKRIRDICFRMSITASGEKSGRTKCCRSAHERATSWSGNVSHNPILAEISVPSLSRRCAGGAIGLGERDWHSPDVHLPLTPWLSNAMHIYAAGDCAGGRLCRGADLPTDSSGRRRRRQASRTLGSPGT